MACKLHGAYHFEDIFLIGKKDKMLQLLCEFANKGAGAVRNSAIRKSTSQEWRAAYAGVSG
jgi:hypothetical protein